MASKLSSDLRTRAILVASRNQNVHAEDIGGQNWLDRDAGYTGSEAVQNARARDQQAGSSAALRVGGIGLFPLASPRYR